MNEPATTIRHGRPLQTGADQEVIERPVYNLLRSQGLPGLDLFLADLHQQPIASQDHVHDALEIIWIREGTAFVEAQGKHFHLEAGEVCVVAPGTPHTGSPNAFSDCAYGLIQISPQLLQTLGRSLSLSTQKSRAVIKHYSAAVLSDTIRKFFETFPRRVDETETAYAVQALLEKVGDVRTNDYEVLIEPPRHHSVEKIKQFIALNCSSDISLERLSAEVRLNKRYMISLFSDLVGAPPRQFQIAMRVDKARRIIQRNTVSLSEVAQITGFADQSHLTRQFKRQYGMSPQAFRQRSAPPVAI